MTESWLDIIPAIPLDRGVPVVNVATKARATIVRVHSVGARWVYDTDNEIDHGTHAWLAESMRVDLDDPQGFKYAMWLSAGPSCPFPIEYCIGVATNILTPTDADRLALARALAECPDDL
jgi:hypothetical protein